MKALWKRFVRWLARKELSELHLQLSLKKMEASLRDLNASMLGFEKAMISGIEKELIFSQGKLAGIKEAREQFEDGELEQPAPPEEPEKKKVLH